MYLSRDFFCKESLTGEKFYCKLNPFGKMKPVHSRIDSYLLSFDLFCNLLKHLKENQYADYLQILSLFSSKEGFGIVDNFFICNTILDWQKGQIIHNPENIVNEFHPAKNNISAFSVKELYQRLPKSEGHSTCFLWKSFASENKRFFQELTGLKDPESLPDLFNSEDAVLIELPDPLFIRKQSKTTVWFTFVKGKVIVKLNNRLSYNNKYLFFKM